MTLLLNQLIGVRSLAAASVIQFLRQYAGELNQPPAFVKHLGLTAQELEVEQWAWTDKPPPRPGKDGFGGKENDGYETRSELDKVVQGLYEIRGTGTEERWANVVKRPRARLILLGAPGQGKTFSTRLAVRQVITTSLAAIESGQRSFHDAPAALWLKASVFAKTGARDLVGALLEALKSDENETPVTACNALVEEWLRRRLAAPDALVIIDSLDEIPDEKQRAAAWRSKVQLCEGVASSVVISCRTLNWNERSGWFNTQNYKEVELVPFKPRQQQEFVRKFFRDERQRRNVEQLLNVNAALRYAAKTPLLMTFLCLGYRAGEVNESTTYTGLYGIVLRNLMSGVWKDRKPAWQGRPDLQAEYLESLARVIWELFPAAPETNRFSSRAWKEAAHQASLKHGWRWTQPPANFLQELENLGLLIQAGYDETHTYPCYSLAHRSLLEYLAARGLSEEPECLEIIYPHLWFEAGWVEVSKFLVGLVKDATPLLERIEAEAADLFGWKLALQFRIIGYANYVAEDCRIEVHFKAVALLGKERWQAENSQTLISYNTLRELVLGNAGEDIVKSTLHLLAYDAEQWVRWKAITDLCELGSASESVIAALLHALENDAAEGVRWKAAEALGQLGVVSESVIAALLHALESDTDEWVRVHAAKALGQLGVASESVVAALLHTYKHDVHPYYAAKALVSLGVTSESVVALLHALENDADKRVRWKAATDLGQLGVASESVIAALLRALENDADEGVRAGAATALGGLGSASESVVMALLHALENDSERVRWGVAIVLGELGVASESVVTALLHALENDADEWVRNSAVTALAKLGVTSESVIAALLHALENDADELIRSLAAAVLTTLGVASESVVVTLLHALENDARKEGHESVAESVAGFLGELGSSLFKSKMAAVRQQSPSRITADALTRIMRGLQAASRKNDKAAEALWHLLWQMPPAMKDEYLSRLRSRSE